MIHLLLPAYDEEEALPGLVESAAAAFAEEPFRILVVDDGSHDRTAEVAADLAARHPLELIRHHGNRGLGAAMATGLEALATRVVPDDWVATMDADGTHDPALILRMREEGDVRRLDLVIASRYAPGGAEIGLSLSRRLLSRGASAFLRLAFRPPPGVRDLSCGFRLYRGELLRRLAERFPGALVEERGFACMAELLLKSLSVGAIAGEAPLVLRYDRKAGRSKMRALPTIAQYLRMAARLRHLPRGTAGEGSLAP